MTHLHVVGTGLIGTSFALAARACFERVTGYDADRDRLAAAVASGAVDEEAATPSGADGVLVAVPVGQVADVVAGLDVPRSTSVFDAGSTKGAPLASLAERLGRVPANFVPCHPMAGSERSGPGAADPELFRARPVFVTPCAETSPRHLARVSAWWRECGAEVRETTAEAHDEAVALTSHLPHLLASAFVASIADRGLEASLEFAGPGYGDFTRIAAADPALWRDITASNLEAITRQLDDYIACLQAVRVQLDAEDLDDLERLLEKARTLRATR